METRTFTVEGMACANCKKRLEEDLLRLNGVSAAEANVEQKNVTVSFDTTLVTPAQLQETAEDCGYGLAL